MVWMTEAGAVQVGRLQPLEDAAAVLHIREAVGATITLRADANQNWSLSQSLQFGHAVKGAGLQVGQLNKILYGSQLIPSGTRDCSAAMQRFVPGVCSVWTDLPLLMSATRLYMLECVFLHAC